MCSFEESWWNQSRLIILDLCISQMDILKVSNEEHLMKGLFKGVGIGSDYQLKIGSIQVIVLKKNSWTVVEMAK